VSSTTPVMPSMSAAMRIFMTDSVIRDSLIR
jgi:hypothetical protein